MTSHTHNHIAKSGGLATSQQPTPHAARAIDPEISFWSWVQDCIKPDGWVRYSPQIAAALKSDRAALVLSYAIHWDGRGRGQHGHARWFYKSIAEWAHELTIPLKAVESALQLLCVNWPVSPSAASNLGLIHRWKANRFPNTPSACYHYRIDWRRLLHWWADQAAPYGQLPLALDFESIIGTFPSVAERATLDWPKRPHCTGQKGQSSVEHLQENTGNDDDDDARQRRETIRSHLRGYVNIHDAGLLDELSDGLHSHHDPIRLIDQICEHDTEDFIRAQQTHRGTPIRSLTGLIVSHLRDEITLARLKAVKT